MTNSFYFTESRIPLTLIPKLYTLVGQIVYYISVTTFPILYAIFMFVVFNSNLFCVCCFFSSKLLVSLFCYFTLWALIIFDKLYRERLIIIDSIDDIHTSIRCLSYKVSCACFVCVHIYKMVAKSHTPIGAERKTSLHFGFQKIYEDQS